MSDASLFQRATKLHQAGDLTEARALYEQVLAAAPTHFKSLHRLALLAHQAGDAAAALSAIDRALQVDSRHAASHMLRGAALEALGRLPEAVAAFDLVIQIDPPSPDASANKAVILTRLGQFPEAITTCDAALPHSSNNAKLHRIRAAALRGGGQHTEAIAALDIAIALRPDFAAAHRERGEILAALKRYPDADASFERALTYDPDMPLVPGFAMAARQQICDWRDYAQRVTALLSRVDAKQTAAEPGILFLLPATPAQQQQSAAAYFRYVTKGHAPAPQAAPGSKIRIGYFSADFGSHAVMQLTAELFERHDKASFEIIAFSLKRRPEDAMLARLRGAFDQFVDVSNLSDEAAASMARDMKIHIAVDLMGYTAYCRPGIFAARVAPIQVNYLGYAGTMAAPCMDYILADEIVVPAEHRPFYSEKICSLPYSYQANDSRRTISDKIFTRRDLGLPESGIVFCSFNGNQKITPDVFDSWMRILGRVNDSVLWLLAADPIAQDNLRREAETRGIAPERIHFANFAIPAVHLARMRVADLFLDTFYFGAHTTASDVLWAGLPVLTMLGATFASRVAASLLTAIGLPDLVACDRTHYEQMAVELAHAPERLAALKQRLAENRHTHPLFDTPRFTRFVETAYRTMMERYWAGEEPRDLYIPDTP